VYGLRLRQCQKVVRKFKFGSNCGRWPEGVATHNQSGMSFDFYHSRLFNSCGEMLGGLPLKIDA